MIKKKNVFINFEFTKLSMNIRYTTKNLNQLEQILTSLGYKILYEKGHFEAGYCLVNEQNMIVINKFFKKEARFECLVKIVKSIHLDLSSLDEKDQSLISACKKD